MERDKMNEREEIQHKRLEQPCQTCWCVWCAVQ